MPAMPDAIGPLPMTAMAIEQAHKHVYAAVIGTDQCVEARAAVLIGARRAEAFQARRVHDSIQRENREDRREARITYITINDTI